MKHALPPAPRTMSTRTKAFLSGGLIALGIAGVGGVVVRRVHRHDGGVRLGRLGHRHPVGHHHQRRRQPVDRGRHQHRPRRHRAAGGDHPEHRLRRPVGDHAHDGGHHELAARHRHHHRPADDRRPVLGRWTESAFPYTYTCSGTTSSVLASTPVVGTNRALSNLALTASATNNLRVTLTLPSAAGNALQGQTSAINYTFTATQRAGTARARRPPRRTRSPSSASAVGPVRRRRRGRPDPRGRRSPRPRAGSGRRGADRSAGCGCARCGR